VRRLALIDFRHRPDSKTNNPARQWTPGSDCFILIRGNFHL